eukprot:3940347-Rhodomonas_salina.6
MLLDAATGCCYWMLLWYAATVGCYGMLLWYADMVCYAMLLRAMGVAPPRYLHIRHHRVVARATAILVAPYAMSVPDIA